ncbi:MAG: efflux transporter outer membrane subunit [Deltaproteobacteria bacterium]|nr:efflux transporter outer membrane subunit [Deltaproteobacteria bacterium]
MKRRTAIALLPFLAVLFMGGCMKMGPDFKRPSPGLELPASFQHDTTSAKPASLTKAWWRAYGNPELNALVEQALKNNWDIRQAAARVMEVRSQFIQTRADRFPSVNLQASAQRQRQTLHAPVPVFNGATIQLQDQQKRETTNAFSLSLPLSYELDLWGRLARAEEGARASLLEAEENRRTIAQAVVAETVTLYLNIEAIERRIQILRKSIDRYRQSLKLVEFRYEHGLTSILDVRQARRILAQAQSSLPTLLQELGTAQQKMAILLGHYPKTRPPRTHPSGYFKELPPVPPGLPSELLLRRPDIMAAEARLRALNAQVGQARANRFPHITLTASFGYASDELAHLLLPESSLWNLAAGLLQPLFDAGRLKAVEEGARARYRQGLAAYAKTLLNAFSEVENGLLTRKEQLERRKRVLVLLEEARATQTVAEGRYKRGLVNYITVLDAQQARFQAEDSLILVDLALLTNRVTLYRSLGGGWEKNG